MKKNGADMNITIEDQIAYMRGEVEDYKLMDELEKIPFGKSIIDTLESVKKYKEEIETLEAIVSDYENGV